jgi:hypothetical protein
LGDSKTIVEILSYGLFSSYKNARAPLKRLMVHKSKISKNDIRKFVSQTENQEAFWSSTELGKEQWTDIDWLEFGQCSGVCKIYENFETHDAEE